jgi:hypothetical protein
MRMRIQRGGRMTKKSNKPHCGKCGRALSDPFSIAVGMGPECRGGMKKKGWKFPKPTYRVHAGRVELVGMVGEVTPPAPTGDLTDRKKKKGKVKDDQE